MSTHLREIHFRIQIGFPENRSLANVCIFSWQLICIHKIKFPFKRSSSVSMHVKARNVFQVPRPYQGFCPGPKHFIVNCNKTILN